MKKKMHTICFGLIITLILSACSFGGWSLNIKDAEDIAKEYYDYEHLFQSAAETLIAYSDITILITTSNKASEDEWNHYTVGGLDISMPRKQSLSEEDCIKIHDVLAPLFKICDLELVVRQDTYVNFLLEQRSGRYADLFYNPNGSEIMPGFDVVDDLYITDCWYAAISSD